MTLPAAGTSAVERFLEQRAPRWRRLEQLLDHAEAVPASALGPDVLQELVVLYRQASSDLNRARSLTANPDVLGLLNRLTGRAYRVVHGAGRRRWSIGRILVQFFTEDAPRTLVREVPHLATALACLLAGALLGGVTVLADPAQAGFLVPEMFFSEDVKQRVEKIESSPERVARPGDALAFGAELYTHNIQVGFLAFGLGALTVVLGHVMVFSNGIILGAVAAQYLTAGEQVFFAAWVGPHGALELPAILVAAAAGSKLGVALLLPGDRSRRMSLAGAAPAACRLLLTAVSLFVVAGLIEGSFSQMTSRTVPFGLKIAAAVALMLGLVAWGLTGLRVPRRPVMR